MEKPTWMGEKEVNERGRRRMAVFFFLLFFL